MSNKNSSISVNEIVSSLKRTNLPTILVEGTSDAYVYRYLRDLLSKSSIGIQACGGRSALFSIHDRKEEFQNANVVFIADLDSYRFNGIPLERRDIIFTTGYCMENDIYAGSAISEFLEDEDQGTHNLLREIIGRWFAFEVEKAQKLKSELRVNKHIDLISPKGLYKLCPKFEAVCGYKPPEQSFIELIDTEYDLNIRGKQLFQMLARYTSKKGRFSRLNEDNLLEIALKSGENKYINRIVNSIRQQFELNAQSSF